MATNTITSDASSENIEIKMGHDLQMSNYFLVEIDRSSRNIEI
jgi:hypothetical protein